MSQTDPLFEKHKLLFTRLPSAPESIAAIRTALADLDELLAKLEGACKGAWEAWRVQPEGDRPQAAPIFNRFVSNFDDIAYRLRIANVSTLSLRGLMEDARKAWTSGDFDCQEVACFNDESDVISVPILRAEIVKARFALGEASTITFTDQAGHHFTPQQLNFIAGEHPERTLRRAVLSYRTAGLSAQELAEDIPAEPVTGKGGILHYASFAKVSADFSTIEVELAFVVGGVIDHQ